MNAHVRSFSDGRGYFSGAIGQYQPQTENFNGAMMRKFLACLSLQAENTKHQTAAGPTYWAPTGQGSRVDYAMIPKNAAERVRGIQVWRRAAHQLQLFRTARLRDHSPIMLTMQPDNVEKARDIIDSVCPDKLWGFINGVVFDSAKKQVRDSPQTADLREQANAQFKVLRDLPTTPLAD
ncbi:unnamed protein product [Polarella glacialis]|uniref:Uncharacterized protein n=1 Tax=Polarella glacialis TaxID=89957 RepID=A0A813IH09_POLGL|nr:unnamed protein product [Polarella glacialis]